jgi:fibronectin-binding autotransporter adhesin
LNFNHTGNGYAFAPTISGAGTINFLAGTTILTGNSSGFTGSTNVSNSTLSVKGSLGSSLAVNAGGRLQGSGSVGTTTINAGGTLAPTDVKPLTVNGDLTLQTGSAFDFSLGHSSTGASSTTSATVAINGNLALNNATLNIVNPSEPGVGYYRMMTYAGTLSGTGMTIGATPPDPGPFPVAYSVDISRANVVDLVVGSNGTNVLQRWGGGTTGTGGGNGVWNSGNLNWLDLGGTVPAGWGASYGVFLGPGGTVAVQGEQSLVGMQFVSGAYTIVSDTGTPGTLRLRGLDGMDGIAELRVLSGESATIDAPMVGAGGFNKTADGTLILGGTNTYTGGTTISGGTL